ncbi:MAG TPA: GNAT family N-acetyltransferase, partial [Ktedonobacteraceae bacterium]|nr:GNAT family N-acetyltransferase [Ktedonobacteraceae bacterium]
EEERKRLLEPLQDMVVRYVLRYGEITCTPDLRSAACWLPPGRTSLTDLGFLLAGALPAMLNLGRATLQRAAQIETLMSRQQKRIVPGPHWSLAILAVDPPYQGQGLGSQLLRAGTARADAANLPCSLDTATARNVPLYQRFGFQVVHEEEVEGTHLPLWNMLRQPGGQVDEWA